MRKCERLISYEEHSSKYKKLRVFVFWFRFSFVNHLIIKEIDYVTTPDCVSYDTCLSRYDIVWWWWIISCGFGIED